jgi:hypothetical protein
MKNSLPSRTIGRASIYSALVCASLTGVASADFSGVRVDLPMQETHKFSLGDASPGETGGAEGKANCEIDGSDWNPNQGALWLVQSNPQVIYKVAFTDGPDGDIENRVVKSWTCPDRERALGWEGSKDLGDWEACAMLPDLADDSLFILSENGSAIIRVDDLNAENEHGTPTKVWSLGKKAKDANDNLMHQEGAKWGNGEGAEGLEFITLPDTINKVPIMDDKGHLVGYETGIYLETTYYDANGVKSTSSSPYIQKNYNEGEGAPMLGQLAVVGHQYQGRLYFFEINPEVSEEFTPLGYRKTNANEVCGLHWDENARDLYIWHGQDLKNYTDPNSLELWHLAVEPNGYPSGVSSKPMAKRTFELVRHFDGSVCPGNTGGVTSNYESIVMVDHNGQYGAGPAERRLFLIEDLEAADKENGDRLPVTALLLPHVPTADLNGDDTVDEIDEEIMIAAMADPDHNIQYDVNGDGLVDIEDFREILVQVDVDQKSD